MARSLLAIDPHARDDVPLWGTTQGGRAWYLPRAGYRLVLPMADASGAIVAARLRSVQAGARVKELAVPGYGCQGAVYAPWSVRAAWAAGLPCPRPCVLVEGGPDWLAAGGAWHETHDVIGYVSGSMTGVPWARWLGLLHPDSILVPQEDPKKGDREPAGQHYARLIREAVPWIRVWPMRAVYAAAGADFAPGDDLAELPRRGVAVPKIQLFCGAR